MSHLIDGTTVDRLVFHNCISVTRRNTKNLDNFNQVPDSLAYIIHPYIIILSHYTVY